MLLLIATLSLLVGSFLALIVRGNPLRAWLAIASQAVAATVVLIAALPVLFGAAPLQALLPWPPPLGDVRLQVEALDAFSCASRCR